MTDGDNSVPDIPQHLERRAFLMGAAAAAATTALPAAQARTPARPVAADVAPDDAMALAHSLRRGDITPLEALDAALARVEALPQLNAVVIRDYDQARAQARQLSALGRDARERATAQAPLWGVPFVLKDLGVAMAGTVTSNGCAFFKDAVAPRDSTLVQRYKAAGLNIFGKTASPEFGMTTTTESRLYGATRNPWSPGHTTGGSSGGTAAAVAAGIVAVGHASDGGGSIRIPAAHCGLFGLKPSRGRVPAGPDALDGAIGLSVNHVISRSVRDSALLLDLTAGPEAGSRVHPPLDVQGGYLQALQQPERRLRIAVWRKNYFGVPVHADCLAAVDRAVALCEAMGHVLEEAMPQLPVAEIYAGMGPGMSAGLLSAVQYREKQLGRAVREDEMEPLNWLALQGARKASALDLYRGRAGFDRAGQLLDAFLADYDLILTPTTAVPAQLLGALRLDQPYESYAAEAMKSSAFTSLFNISGHPAMSVPLHWTAQDLPVGSHFVAPFGGEGRLLRLAAQLEQAQPWAQRRPDLSALQA
ncbi:amidase/aspartyl-tRNA(Asn)/glutamyl-tRNA(Gln) amidotransferase subunit A [Oryzisolibacter propanilivorax]|uniref:Amidase/aspartyl-tRNA(Asn)/glutamyl-tRNA(Gln) amidotransferase subunit A n=1 Tax=Oryzisolibacter propanilivorax TaxID=1527607 RepID=A0A1G9NX59_9BURK|nr:amidase/aspartyl-tRNA(Asn)/glutamyl-tRNA(Gln) amidotransferase subunit A [Oryzisolibacter propanilivorax]